MDDFLSEFSNKYLIESMKNLLRKPVDAFQLEFLDEFQEIPIQEIVKEILKRVERNSWKVFENFYLKSNPGRTF